MGWGNKIVLVWKLDCKVTVGFSQSSVTNDEFAHPLLVLHAVDVQIITYFPLTMVVGPVVVRIWLMLARRLLCLAISRFHASERSLIGNEICKRRRVVSLALVAFLHHYGSGCVFVAVSILLMKLMV